MTVWFKEIYGLQSFKYYYTNLELCEYREEGAYETYDTNGKAVMARCKKGIDTAIRKGEHRQMESGVAVTYVIVSEEEFLMGSVK